MRRVRGRHAKRQFSKQIVVLVILLYVAFVMGVWIVGQGGFTTPDSLILGVTAFLGTQLWNLKDIKKAKIAKGEQNNDQV